MDFAELFHLFQLILNLAELFLVYVARRRLCFSLFWVSKILFQLILDLADFCSIVVGSRKVVSADFGPLRVFVS